MVMGSYPDIVLVVDDEAATRTGVAVAVGSTGRSVVSCGDIESAQMIVDRVAVRSVITDIRLTGPFSYDGLHFLDYIARQAPQSQVVLMTGFASPELRTEATSRGAAAVLEKPFTITELDAVLPETERTGLLHRPQPLIIDVPPLNEILDASSVFSVFQPIIQVREAGITSFGFEALTRVGSTGPFANPEFLFEYADRKQRVGELEAMCIANAMREASVLPPDSSIFVNIHPGLLADHGFASLILALARRHDLPLDRLVLEITEQAAIKSIDDTMHNIDQLAERGVRFAFDDVGVAYSHLLHLERIRPAFMKISQQFGTDLDLSESKTKIIRNIVSLGRDFGCHVILEGVESEEAARAAHEAGITLLQGFLFGKPSLAAEWAVDA